MSEFEQELGYIIAFCINKFCPSAVYEENELNAIIKVRAKELLSKANNGRYIKIPSSYEVGGQNIEVRRVERCENNNSGICFLGGGYMEIAEMFNKDDKQSESCKVNTFFHELTHSILDTMGENDLSKNEKFVSCFAGFLTEAMKKAVFEEEAK